MNNDEQNDSKDPFADLNGTSQLNEKTEEEIKNSSEQLIDSDSNTNFEIKHHEPSEEAANSGSGLLHSDEESNDPFHQLGALSSNANSNPIDDPFHQLANFNTQQNQDFQNNFNQQGNLGFNQNPNFSQQGTSNYNTFAGSLNANTEFLNNFQGQTQQLQNWNLQQGTPIKKMIENSERNRTYLQMLGEKLFLDKENRKLVSVEEKAEVDSKLEYLVYKINLDLKKYRNYERKAGSWAFIFKLLSSSLAALVTVLLGINVSEAMAYLQWSINLIALVISAFITIINVFQDFFDAGPLHIKYVDTANQLEMLLDNVEYLKLGGAYICLADVNMIKGEYDRIIESTHNYELEVKADDQRTAATVKQQGRV